MLWLISRSTDRVPRWTKDVFEEHALLLLSTTPVAFSTFHPQH